MAKVRLETSLRHEWNHHKGVIIVTIEINEGNLNDGSHDCIEIIL